MIRVGIITASDKGSRGEREDLSQQAIRDEVASIGAEVVAYELVPDEKDILVQKLKEMCSQADLIFTTGGTGLGPRDVTPEATREVMEKEVPGISEAMRWASLQKTPRAMLSRAMAVTRGQTLIINLPGSPKAVRECLQAILPALPHGIEILKGETGECARP
ncbi:MAG: MogA/MoaB family molybdenum cofactor biosynthesis protein [Clostridia bacterium]|nr:MogA/MoaB family molybdenum cofactor biosynthesis protein [Clostridia bacterium]